MVTTVVVVVVVVVVVGILRYVGRRYAYGGQHANAHPPYACCWSAHDAPPARGSRRCWLLASASLTHRAHGASIRPLPDTMVSETEFRIPSKLGTSSLYSRARARGVARVWLCKPLSAQLASLTTTPHDNQGSINTTPL